MKTLSVRQPWAWLIVQGYKTIENRTWVTDYRGPLLIHAGRQMDADWREIVDFLHDYSVPCPQSPDEFERGGVVGVATLVDIVTTSASQWFEGPYGWVLKDARPLPFVPMAGRLQLFNVDIPDDVLNSQIEPLARTKKMRAARRLPLRFVRRI